MTVGERIKARRIELGLNQTELAKMINLKDKTSISKIENGSPNLETVEKIAIALKCSVPYLMGWDKTKPDTPFISNMREIEKKLNDGEISHLLAYAYFLTQKKNTPPEE